jgi:hypothetical protein
VILVGAALFPELEREFPGIGATSVGGKAPGVHLKELYLVLKSSAISFSDLNVVGLARLPPVFAVDKPLKWEHPSRRKGFGNARGSTRRLT